jgi:1-acyl-sn-glycerol-3-phosphate acyltransferase
MIGKLFYLCLSCLAEDSLEYSREFIHCQNCQKSYPFKNNQILYNNHYYSISQFYRLVRASLILNKNQSKTSFRISKEARLRQGIKAISFRGRNQLHSVIEVPVEVDHGELVINEDSLIFRGIEKKWIFPQKNITGYTTNSKYFEFKVADLPFFQIYFEHESPLKYEDLFTAWFSKYNLEKKQMIEHQPRISKKLPPLPSLILSHRDIKNRDIRERFSITEFFLHIFVGMPIVAFLRWYANLTFSGEHLVPDKGPFILLMNHQSYLDPIIISTLLPRRIGFLTKSTSFADKFLQPIFRAYRSLPNRRYEIDPQVVRHALKGIQQGNCIGIFPEGERTWDGDLLPFKYSTIKFLLSVQIPVVIVTIKGAYNVLPRWTHKINPGQIKARVQRCFSLIPGRWQIEDLKEELESFFKVI